MSKNPYKIIKIETPQQLQETLDQLHYKAEIDATSAIFDGHFPQQPVVPGVCTLGMIKECVADTLSRKVRFAEVKECKFLAAILPSIHSSVDVFITLKGSDGADAVNVTALVKHESTIMMKLKAIAI